MKNLLTSNDTTNYTINLVNKGATAKNFWCFLAKPEGVPNSNVFANSNTMLSVIPNYQGSNTFTIPLQYKVAAGAKNDAVGLNIQVDASILKDAQLESTWLATYATAPPKQGPLLNLVQGQNSPKNTISLESNKFNQVQNHDNKWFSNMSFGIETEEGFAGVTWAPSPNNDYIVTPKFKFYISTGSYSSNALADIDDIARTSAVVSLEDFENLEATVTLDSSGGWLVTPGAPSQS